MLRNMLGIMSFQAVCPSAENFINALKASNISCTNIRVEKGLVLGEVVSVQAKGLAALARDQRSQISFTGRRGLRFKIQRYHQRMGVLIGIAAAAAIIFYFSNIVLKIEIQGNQNISSERLMDLLEESGIAPGKFIPAMDLTQAEKKIKASDRELAWVGLRSSGGRIVLEVDEMTPHEKVLPAHIPCNIVASRDAQLIKAEVYSGKLVPRIGEGVRKGDLLVSGADTDIHGLSTVTHANASVIGQYTEKQCFTQAMAQQAMIPTGEVIRRNSLTFFGLEIPLFLGREPKGDFECDESKTGLSFFQIDLPVGITRRSYQLLEAREKTYTPEEAEEMALQQMEEYEEVFYRDIQIIKKQTQKIQTDTTVSIIVTYVLEGEIGTNVEIILKEEKTEK